MRSVGKTIRAIAEGYIPSHSTSQDRALASHGAACILNAGPSDAHIRITVFLSERDAMGLFHVRVPAGVRCTCDPTILTIPSPFPGTPTIRRCSNPMCLSSFSIANAIRERQRSHSSRALPMARTEQGEGIRMVAACGGSKITP